MWSLYLEYLNIRYVIDTDVTTSKQRMTWALHLSNDFTRLVKYIVNNYVELHSVNIYRVTCIIN